MTTVKTTETKATETKVQTTDDRKGMVNELAVIDQKNSMVTLLKKNTTEIHQYPTGKF
jgi:predicted ATP-dependent protease